MGASICLRPLGEVPRVSRLENTRRLHAAVTGLLFFAPSSVRGMQHVPATYAPADFGFPRSSDERKGELNYRKLHAVVQVFSHVVVYESLVRTVCVG